MRRDNLRSEYHKVLSAAGLNPRFHVKVWSQATHAIHQPLSSGDCIGFGRASTHCFAAALSGQPFGTGNDDSRICNKQVRWPLNHGSNGALFGIASSVSEPLTTKHRFRPFALGFVSATHAVNARTAIIVDRHFRVDRFIAQPAPPPVSFPNFVKPTHLASSIRRFGLFGPGHSGLRVNGSGAAASKCSLTVRCGLVVLDMGGGVPREEHLGLSASALGILPDIMWLIGVFFSRGQRWRNAHGARHSSLI